MPGEKTKSIEDLLKRPEVEKAVSNINRELIERRQYSPPKCEVFSHSYTALREDEHYTFFIDKEATKELPRIIATTLVAKSNPAPLATAYSPMARETPVVATGGTRAAAIATPGRAEDKLGRAVQ